MDEYTYEDFDDIVPSQDLVPAHSTHKHNLDDTDIAQPSKRVKTTPGDEDPSDNPPDTQLTQLPDVLRKIPGPAGTLPPMHTTSIPSPSKAVVLSQTGNPEHNGVLMQSKLFKKARNGHANGTQDEYIRDFTRGTWLVMLQNSELPPFGMSHFLFPHFPHSPRFPASHFPTHTSQ